MLKYYFLDNTLPWSGSLLGISECKAHTPSESFLIAALETSNVTWSPPQHRAMHSPLEWVHGRPLWYTTPSAWGYWSLFLVSCQLRGKMGQKVPSNIFDMMCLGIFRLPLRRSNSSTENSEVRANLFTHVGRKPGKQYLLWLTWPS